MKKAAIYVRTSTKGQHVENQEPDCVQLAAARGLDVVEVYREQESAVKHRPVFEQLMADAHAGKFQTLVLWRLDRLGRRMAGNINDVLSLDRAGVEVVSVREPWLDSGGPARNLLLGIFSWLAEEERRVLVERTVAGLERARRQGKRIGRPPASPVMLHAARDLVTAGVSVAAAAKRKGVARSTLRRFLLCNIAVSPTP